MFEVCDKTSETYTANKTSTKQFLHDAGIFILIVSRVSFNHNKTFPNNFFLDITLLLIQRVVCLLKFLHRFRVLNVKTQHIASRIAHLTVSYVRCMRFFEKVYNPLITYTTIYESDTVPHALAFVGV